MFVTTYVFSQGKNILWNHNVMSTLDIIGYYLTHMKPHLWLLQKASTLLQVHFRELIHTQKIAEICFLGYKRMDNERGDGTLGACWCYENSWKSVIVLLPLIWPLTYTISS